MKTHKKEQKTAILPHDPDTQTVTELPSTHPLNPTDTIETAEPQLPQVETPITSLTAPPDQLQTTVYHPLEFPEASKRRKRLTPKRNPGKDSRRKHWYGGKQAWFGTQTP